MRTYLLLLVFCCSTSMVYGDNLVDSDISDRTSVYQSNKEMIAKLKKEKQTMMQTRIASQRARKWSQANEVAHNKRIKEINAKLKKLSGNNTGGGQLSKKEKIAKAQRELQALESKKVAEQRNKTWTKADETNYKAEKQKLNSRLKKLGYSGGQSNKTSESREAEYKRVEITMKLQSLASQRSVKQRNKNWTKADESAYSKKVNELKARLKKLESQ